MHPGGHLQDGAVQPRQVAFNRANAGGGESKSGFTASPAGTDALLAGIPATLLQDQRDYPVDRAAPPPRRPQSDFGLAHPTIRSSSGRFSRECNRRPLGSLVAMLPMLAMRAKLQLGMTVVMATVAATDALGAVVAVTLTVATADPLRTTG